MSDLIELRDKVAILIPHFSFAGYKTNGRNLERVVEELPRYAKVVIGELSLTDDFHPLSNFRIKGEEKNILWQKEPLINAMIKALPPEYEYIVWMDEDFLFKNPYWLDLTLARLAYDCDVVQCYSHLQYLDADGKPQSTHPSLAFEHFTMSRTFKFIGTPGGVWAARRSFLYAIGGLHSANVVGGGDRTFAEDVLKLRTERYARDGSKALNQANLGKRAIIRAHLKNKVDYIPGLCQHLYHGKMRNRQYRTRYDAIREFDFDPADDIKLDDSGIGIVEWASDKPQLHESIKNYFIGRDEDS